MPQYSFLVREKLERNRIYKIDAATEAEARDFLDGFKQEPVEQPAAQENIIVWDYDVKECYRSKPEIGDAVLYKDNLGALSSLRGNWIVTTENDAIPIRAVELEWDEENNRWFVLEGEK